MKILLFILIDLLFVLSSLYEMQMLQQNGYNNKNKFNKFLRKEYKDYASVYLLKYLLAIMGLLFINGNKIIASVFYIILFILNINAYSVYKLHNDKLPLKFTKRLIRIFILDYLLFLLIQYISISVSINIFMASTLFYIAMNGYILIVIVNFLKPVEISIYNHYKKLAINKLNSMNDIKIIGVTGSFGKTSTKMILNTILKTKYKGFCTPESYNTPNGTLLTINNEKTIFNDYFISEMGARKEGEIKELADLVHPKYGIITSIGEAHLETFGSIENICNTKFELIESLPEDGVAILNKDDKYQRNYKLKNKCKVIWIGIEKEADVMASNIKITNKGTCFEVAFKGEKKKLKLQTKLLGNKNIYNILSSIALAKELGVENSMIEVGVNNIECIPHRLELKQFGSLTILDDAYNSNPKGAENAVNALSLMEGTKIIITPGMIEMGEQQNKLNNNFGKQIAKVADYVYLIGEKQTKPIYKGLEKEKFDMKKVFVLNDFKKAYNEALEISGKKTILIENDLPDSYKEVK